MELDLFVSASFKPNCTELVVLDEHKMTYSRGRQGGQNDVTQEQVNCTIAPHSPKVNKNKELTYLLDGRMDRWMDRQTDVLMDRGSHGQTDRLADVQMDRQTNIQTAFHQVAYFLNQRAYVS
jgi:hypothetical protein